MHRKSPTVRCRPVMEAAFDYTVAGLSVELEAYCLVAITRAPSRAGGSTLDF